MKIMENIRNSCSALKKTFKRFPAGTVNLYALFAVIALYTVTEFDDKWFIFLLPVLLCGAFVSVALSLLQEKCAKESLFIKRSLYIVPAIFDAVWYVLSFAIREEYYLTACGGICLCAVLVSIWAVTDAGKNLSGSAHLLKGAGFAFLSSLVTFIGGAICIGAFIVLIFDFNSSYKLFLLLLEFSALLGLLLVLSGTPHPKKEHPELPKAYKAIILYTELTLYFILTAVLYIYLFKMVFTLHLPSGGVNPYVTVASAAYIFNIFAAGGYAQNSKLAKFFTKYGGMLMLPLIAIQCVAVGIRLYYYGLTSTRMLSLCFIAVTLIFALGSFIKHIGFGKSLLFAACLSFVIFCTPFNVFDVPVYQQTHMLKNVLEENGMLTDGEVVPASREIPQEDKEKIISAHRYIRYHAINTPKFFEDLSDKNISEIYGFEVESASATEYIWYNNEMFARTGLFDVSQYKYIYDIGYEHFSSEKQPHTTIILIDGTETEYNLMPVIETLISKYGYDGYRSGNQPDEVIALDENTDFYYEGAGFTIDRKTGKLSDFSIEGFILIKQ